MKIRTVPENLEQWKSALSFRAHKDLYHYEMNGKLSKIVRDAFVANGDKKVTARIAKKILETVLADKSLVDFLSSDPTRPPTIHMQKIGYANAYEVKIWGVRWCDDGEYRFENGRMITTAHDRMECNSYHIPLDYNDTFNVESFNRAACTPEQYAKHASEARESLNSIDTMAGLAIELDQARAVLQDSVDAMNDQTAYHYGRITGFAMNR